MIGGVTAFIVGLIYYALMLVIVYGVKRMKAFEFNDDIEPKTQFSVIIPFRNEANYLPALLTSLEGISYPNDSFEVLLVDDASEDTSVKLIEDFMKTSALDIQILKSTTTEGSPKKRALQLGVLTAKNKWIVTTDADCSIPKNWLYALNGFILETMPNMVVMPVFLKTAKASALEIIETLSLQLVTIGTFGLKKPVISNGANLAFEKATFLKCNGYKKNLNIASGDDLFLMESFIKARLSVRYLKSEDVIVSTYPQESLTRFFQQRVRWASKTGASKNWFLKFLGAIIFMMNISIVLFFVLALFQQVSFYAVCLCFILKNVADLTLLQHGYNMFKTKSYNGHVIFTNIYYPFLNTYIGIHSLFGGYTWKGRYFKR